MSPSIHQWHVAATPQPTLRLFRGRNPVFFWSDVIDTPWLKTMRSQIIAATLVSGPSELRTWRFHSPTPRHRCAAVSSRARVAR